MLSNLELVWFAIFLLALVGFGAYEFATIFRNPPSRFSLRILLLVTTVIAAIVAMFDALWRYTP